MTVDLYRDIHKGIRAELFAVDGGRPAGSILATAPAAWTWPATSDGVVELLVTHAEHEDRHVQPAIELHLPELADRIVTRPRRARSAHGPAPGAGRGRRRCAGRPTSAAARTALYLELASFTSAYLEHQDVEERVVMPALEAAIGLESTVAIHQAIIGSIPPDEMASRWPSCCRP